MAFCPPTRRRRRTYEAKETVPLRRLDRLFDEWMIDPDERVLLKLDVQGMRTLFWKGWATGGCRLPGFRLTYRLRSYVEGKLLDAEVLALIKGAGF